VPERSRSCGSTRAAPMHRLAGLDSVDAASSQSGIRASIDDGALTTVDSLQYQVSKSSQSGRRTGTNASNFSSSINPSISPRSHRESRH
jgi:hypothetical protein